MTRADVPALAAATRAALAAARGSRTVAARALGISRSGLTRRLALPTWPGELPGELLIEWTDRLWPQRHGPPSSGIVEARNEGGMRHYRLDCGTVGRPHTKTVRQRGARPKRMVCEMCKGEKR